VDETARHFGLDVATHFDPFHDSTSVWREPLLVSCDHPTALHADAALHDTRTQVIDNVRTRIEEATVRRIERGLCDRPLGAAKCSVALLLAVVALVTPLIPE
jgi:hypothetical protein